MKNLELFKKQPAIGILNFTPKSKSLNFDFKLWNKILSLDLEQVFRKLVFRAGFDQVRAKNAIASYRQYLYLSAQGYNLSPDKDTDEAWHNHILDMQKYNEDCINTFGKVIWHVPNEIDANGKTVRHDRKDNESCGAMCHTCSCNTNCCAVAEKTDNNIQSSKSCMNCNSSDECSSDIKRNPTIDDVSRIKFDFKLDFKTLVRITFPSN